MIQQEILENNKLIAEFLGITITTDGISWFDTNYKSLCKYDISWNDLMPVIEKIENNGCIIEIWLSLGKGCKIIKGGFKEEIKTIANNESNSIIEAIYLSVIDYIKWYNNEQINKNK